MSTTPNLLISHIAASQNQKEVTANTAFDDLDLALCGLKSIALSDADYNVVQADFLTNMVLIFTGALTATRNIILTANKKPIIISNQTTGGKNLIVKVGTGVATALLTDNAYYLLYCDGVNTVSFIQGGEPTAVTGSGPEVLQIQPIVTLPRFTSYTVAGLPLSSISLEGMLAYATNGRKVGQGPGAGTGVPVYFSNGAWRVYSTDAPVAA